MTTALDAFDASYSGTLLDTRIAAAIIDRAALIESLPGLQQALNAQSKSKTNTALIVGLVVGLGAPAVIGAAAATTWLVRRRRRSQEVLPEYA